MAARKKGEPPNRTKTTKPKASRGKTGEQGNGLPWGWDSRRRWRDQRLKDSQKKDSSRYGNWGPRPTTPAPRPKIVSSTSEGGMTLAKKSNTSTSSKPKASASSKPKSWAKTYTKPSSARAQSAAARARRKKK